MVSEIYSGVGAWLLPRSRVPEQTAAFRRVLTDDPDVIEPGDVAPERLCCGRGQPWGGVSLELLHSIELRFRARRHAKDRNAARPRPAPRKKPVAGGPARPRDKKPVANGLPGWRKRSA